MRTIKFRGQFVYTNALTGQFDWVYGDLVHYPEHTGKHKIICEGGSQFEVLASTVGQFTGLHDKNGKDIYEGDIVQLNEFVYEVGYDDKRFASFVLLRKQDMYKHYFGEALEANQVDIIGNIHDNPELLKGGNV